MHLSYMSRRQRLILPWRILKSGILRYENELYIPSTVLTPSSSARLLNGYVEAQLSLPGLRYQGMKDTLVTVRASRTKLPLK